MGTFLGVGIISSILFGYFIFDWIRSRLTAYGWLAAAFVAEVPAGLFIGWFLAMRQIGMSRASAHTSKVRVAREVHEVADRATEVLRQMKMRVHAIKLDGSAAEIKASPQTERKTGSALGETDPPVEAGPTGGAVMPGVDTAGRRGTSR